MKRWCLKGEVGAADGQEGAADGEGGEVRGQVVCREGRGCRVEMLKGGGMGPLLTQVFSRIRGARLIGSQPSPRRDKEIREIKKDKKSSKVQIVIRY